MAVVENLDILKKRTNGQTMAKVTLAMSDNLRLEFAKMCVAKIPSSYTHDEFKVFKTLAINLMEESRRMDPFEEITSRCTVMDGDLLKAVFNHRAAIRKIRQSLPKDDLEF
ncbi:hypothetical protein RF11_05860 [Thelohanellus kitauei]|uniref:Uncharacterized protein n=1 Tax=Thelohanellus kitauei TaxID=669202 RepID=A0A0C2IWA2_THEKT|nr:hypothetical protein RF11_05860 [Thelohanellus kitauei]